MSRLTGIAYKHLSFEPHTTVLNTELHGYIHKVQIDLKIHRGNNTFWWFTEQSIWHNTEILLVLRIENVCRTRKYKQHSVH